jgi:DNA ligase-1
MKDFAQLFQELDSTTRTAVKVEALVRYFRIAPPADAAWGLFFLTENRIKRTISTARLREWAAELAGLPLWLVEESFDAVGDLAEALSLIVPPVEHNQTQPLTELVEQRILPLRTLDELVQKQLVQTTWRTLPTLHAFLWLKLITGEFRVGAAKTLVIRALAEVAEVEPAVMAHRLMGNWQPTAEFFSQLLQPETINDAARPYPFFLAHPLAAPPESLGQIDDWQVEWKWDGIRAQLLHRRHELSIWSRGEELMTDRFPELHALANIIPDGAVLDGEVLAFANERPLPFAAMQTRIGRKKLSAKVLQASPAIFMAYDLLELDGEDTRTRPLAERRMLLEKLGVTIPVSMPFRVSPLVNASTWDDLKQRYSESRERAVEGLMLKRRGSPYGVGRIVGEWWKWKSQPLTIDAVLVYAQRGHGRRASLFSDYTFAVWNDQELVPMAKAYSGLTDEEMHAVDSFVRRNTIERFGPVHVVKPELVFELHFEGIQRSTRHKSGVAVRFPRMGRWRQDKQPQDADTLQTLHQMLAMHENNQSPAASAATGQSLFE